MNKGSIINLAGGAPEFETPEEAKEAARRAIDRGDTRYVSFQGLPELRSAIAQTWSAQKSVDLSSDNVFVGAGAKAVIFAVLRSRLQEGGQVLFARPHYAAYPALIRLAGGTPVPVDVDPATGKLTPEIVSEHLSKNTRVVIINSPANPHGVVYTRQELAEVTGEVMRGSSAIILSDEVYEAFVYTAEGHVSPLSLVGLERCVAVGAVSKTFGMTGWRVGYAVGAMRLALDAASIHRDITNCASSVSQWAALGALSSPAEEVRGKVKNLAHVRDWFVQELNGRTFLSASAPDGSIYLFPHVGAALHGPDGASATALTFRDVDALTNWLEQEGGVAVAAGTKFGSRENVRINLALQREVLSSGLDRLERATKRLGLKERE